MSNYVVGEVELAYLLEQIRKSQSSEMVYELNGELGGIAELVEWVIKSRPLSGDNVAVSQD
jgi:hypothetical protein